ncbi:hypothetical protein CFC21_078292 [Triticum aestivum]|uniref:Uncharacterized protein n=2 Tax=Triticum aestivum TaxID=4565 RepID=A0A9R1HXA4_WHEAT|nr:uncharacterized protein LOC123125047 [Triticum aestivum]KAF7073266.1 hypothetical protein CFC21_078292 [Triticum aestivum]
MASGGGGVMAGKKRKSAEMGRVDVPARREPRRGLGVAALESIRAQLETAESFYVFPSLATAAAAAPTPTPPLPSLLAGHVAGVRFDPYVGNGAAQRDYYPHYYGGEHYTLARRYMQQLQASSGQPAPRHHDHHHAWQSNAAAVAAPAPPVLEQDHRRRAQAHGGGHARKPRVAFVDLVDSDEEDGRGGAEEELDLELKL